MVRRLLRWLWLMAIRGVCGEMGFIINSLFLIVYNSCKNFLKEWILAASTKSQWGLYQKGCHLIGTEQKTKIAATHCSIWSYGDFKYGDKESRTPDLRIANASLYQLSYIPKIRPPNIFYVLFIGKWNYSQRENKIWNWSVLENVSSSSYPEVAYTSVMPSVIRASISIEDEVIPIPARAPTSGIIRSALS